MYYIQLRTSQTRQNQFVWYDATTEQTMLADFKRLWATNFLDDLSIEVTDHTFPNGAVGKMVVYHMEERERIKIVDYRDTDEKSISIIKRTDIDEKLRERSIETAPRLVPRRRHHPAYRRCAARVDGGERVHQR